MVFPIFRSDILRINSPFQDRLSGNDARVKLEGSISDLRGDLPSPLHISALAFSRTPSLQSQRPIR